MMWSGAIRTGGVGSYSEFIDEGTRDSAGWYVAEMKRAINGLLRGQPC